MSRFYDLVIIDSGFCSSKYPDVDVYIKGDEWQIETDDDMIGHGTGVLSIVSKSYAGKFAVFKAFDMEIDNNLPKVMSALNYIYNNITCRVLQLSFGVRGYYPELEEVCRWIYQKGIIIVSAFDNSGAMSYPAAWDFVVGVDGNPYCKTKNDFNVFVNGVVDIKAKSGYQLIETSRTSNGYDIKPGNSYAASYVSLRILENEKEVHTKEDAMKLFRPDYERLIHKNDMSLSECRAAVFPLNKENYSLVNYYDMAVPDIVDIYDIKYSSNVGRSITSFDRKKSFTIKNIDKCEWDTFDTMIIGHVRELSMILGRDVKKELLQKCLENHKNVFCYDNFGVDECRNSFSEAGLSLVTADDYYYYDMFGKLYQFSTPILAVFGTSKKQGKFTLQMQIKRILKAQGVRVGQLSTEPTGLILGCDAIIPTGYDCKIWNSSGSGIIEVVNKKMHELDIRGFDVILCGAQSGFYPGYCFNVNQININAMAFMFGVMPDGVILSVNYHDTVKHIRNNINALEALGCCKVIMLALYAFRTEVDNVINTRKERLSSEEISGFSEKMKKEFGIDVAVSGDAAYDDVILRNIKKYFCEET